MNVIKTLSLAAAIVAAAIAHAQSTNPPICTEPDCNLQEPKQVNGNADTPYVRLVFGTACGSGTIAGQDDEAAYVMTNAHVSGTQPGRVGIVRYTQNGDTKETRGTVIAGGYSNARMVDYAIVKVPGLTTDRPTPYSRKPVAGPNYVTTGSPRCVWPLKTVNLRNPTVRNSLFLASPNAIGGQSGSSIRNTRENAIALLTWSYGGQTGAQTSESIYRVASTQRATEASARVDGLTEMDGTRNPTENVIFEPVARGVKDLPIWTDDEPTTDPGDDNNNPPPTDDTTDEERKLLKLFRDNKSIDWVKLIEAILLLIKAIQG